MGPAACRARGLADEPDCLSRRGHASLCDLHRCGTAPRMIRRHRPTPVVGGPPRVGHPGDPGVDRRPAQPHRSTPGKASAWSSAAPPPPARCRAPPPAVAPPRPAPRCWRATPTAAAPSSSCRCTRRTCSRRAGRCRFDRLTVAARPGGALAAALTRRKLPVGQPPHEGLCNSLVRVNRPRSVRRNAPPQGGG